MASPHETRNLAHITIRVRLPDNVRWQLVSRLDGVHPWAQHPSTRVIVMAGGPCSLVERDSRNKRRTSSNGLHTVCISEQTNVRTSEKGRISVESRSQISPRRHGRRSVRRTVGHPNTDLICSTVRPSVESTQRAALYMLLCLFVRPCTVLTSKAGQAAPEPPSCRSRSHPRSLDATPPHVSRQGRMTRIWTALTASRAP